MSQGQDMESADLLSEEPAGSGEAASVRKPAETYAAWFELAYYVEITVATIVLLTFVLKLWRARLTVPFVYRGDALFAAATVKGMVENGLPWVNPHLGAPGAMNLLDYPGTDFLHYAALKAISLFVRDWAAIANIYFILGFVILALVSAWCLRRLSVSPLPAGVIAILYTFLPFHFLHGEEHLFLSFYFQVPLLCVVALELLSTRPPFIRSGAGAGWDFRATRSWFPILVTVLTGMAGVYYALFGAFFIAVAGVRGWWKTREWRRVVSAVILVGIIFAVAGACLAPYAWHRHVAGSDKLVAARSLNESEVYGLKLAQLLLPVGGHRIGFFARVRHHYLGAIDAIFGKLFDSEAEYIALGLIGSLGFLGLIWFAVFDGSRRRGDDSAVTTGQVADAAALAVAGTLVALVGGLGTVLATLGFTQIRAYARISVFLAFFALYAVAVFFEWAMGRLTGSLRWSRFVIAGLLLVCGVLDQTTGAMVPPYASNANQRAAVALFVKRVEASVPANAKVFQLPYVPFPENPPVVKMIDYDHFRPYLESTKIHWSYGAVKGRSDDAWDQQAAALPVDQMIGRLRFGGFVGIWVDRNGFDDHAQGLIADLQLATGAKAITSSDGRYAYVAIPH